MNEEKVVSKPGGTGGVDPGRAAIRFTRRAVLASAVSLAGAASGRAAPTALPGSPTILVAGPPGGMVDRWAALIAAPLGKSLLQDDAVGRENVGGPDGVTGANHFQTATPPDGATAMIMPGTTALSWLVGDSRVRFDAGTWAPLWGATVPVIVLSRTPLVRGRPVRVAVPNFIGPELAALLALDLMGIDAVPVRIGPEAALPLDRADLDVIVLRGASLRQYAAELAAHRWTRAFGLGAIRPDEHFRRDPEFTDVPTAFELLERGPIVQGGTERQAALLAALRSVAAAATLDVALVLPLLAPAAIVAWWRQGCTALASAPDVQDVATRNLVRTVEAGSVAASMATITADPSVLLELRRWLAERHQWHPG